MTDPTSAAAVSRREQLRSFLPAVLTWGVIGVTFVAGYIAFLRTFPVFVPDSRYYLAMALHFAGESQETARAHVVQFAAQFGVPIPPLHSLFGWGLVQPRIVLPTLAVPFVWAFGPYGLVVLTGIISVGLTITLAWVLIRRFGNLPALAVMVLVNCSPYLVWFNGAMLTESLSALWTVFLIVIAWRYMRNPHWAALLALGVITALAAFTRQATLIDAGAFLMAWLLGSMIQRRNSPWMFPAIVVSATSIACQIVQSLVFPSFSQADQFITSSGATTLGGALLTIPAKAFEILRTDVATFLAGDHALLAIVVLSVISMLVFWRHEESHLLFGAILAVALYNITNGTPTTFRYAVPGLAFYLLSLGLMFSKTQSALSRSDVLPRGAEKPTVASR